VVIYDLNFPGVHAFSNEADPKLIVHPDAVLAKAIRFESFQIVAPNECEISQAGCGVKDI